MVDAPPEGRGRGRRWVSWSGLAAAAGALLWTAVPWIQSAVLGTRPYVATVFDVVSLGGWLLMAAGLVGVAVAFGTRYGRLGRASVGATGAGMTIIAALLARSVFRFVDAGFRAVPATGEDPAGLVLTLGTLLGLGLTVVGAGGLGVALRRVDDVSPVATGLLVSAPVVPLVVVGLRLLSRLPLSVGRLAVGTNLVLVPLGLGWAALGAVVWRRFRPPGGR